MPEYCPPHQPTSHCYPLLTTPNYSNNSNSNHNLEHSKDCDTKRSLLLLSLPSKAVFSSSSSNKRPRMEYRTMDADANMDMDLDRNDVSASMVRRMSSSNAMRMDANETSMEEDEETEEKQEYFSHFLQRKVRKPSVNLHQVIGTRRRYFSNELAKVVKQHCRSFPDDAKFPLQYGRSLRLPLHQFLDLYWEDIRNAREEQNALVCLQEILHAFPAAVFERNNEGKLPIQLACERMPVKHWEYLFERTKFLTAKEVSQSINHLPLDVAIIICDYMYESVDANRRPLFDVSFALQYLKPVIMPKLTNVMIHHSNVRCISRKYARVKHIMHYAATYNNATAPKNNAKLMRVMDYLCRQNMTAESVADRKCRIKLLCDAIKNIDSHLLITRQKRCSHHPLLHNFLICSLPLPDHAESILQVLDLVQQVCPQALKVRGHLGRTALHYFFCSLHEVRLYDSRFTADMLDRKLIRDVMLRFPKEVLLARDGNDCTAKDLAMRMFRISSSSGNAWNELFK